MNSLRTVLLLLAAAACFASTAGAVDSLQTYLRAGADSLAEGAHAAALVEFQKALRLDPDNFAAIKNIGRIHARLGDHDQARVFLERAFKMNPVDAQVCNNLGVVYSDLGNSAEAIRYFENAVAVDSTNAMYLTNLGQEYFKMGKIGPALPLLRSALAFDPKNAIIPYSMGNCFAASQSYDSAEYYYRLAAASGGRPAELYYRLGTVQRHLGKTEAAMESMVEALSRQPDYRECRQSLAMLLMAEGHYRQATEHFDRLVAGDSSFYPAWVGLGTAYALDGRTEDADRILSHLFAVDSTWGFRMLDLVRQERSKADHPEAEQ